MDITERAEVHHTPWQPAAVSRAVPAHRRITHGPNGTDHVGSAWPDDAYPAPTRTQDRNRRIDTERALNDAQSREPVGQPREAANVGHFAPSGGGDDPPPF